MNHRRPVCLPLFAMAVIMMAIVPSEAQAQAATGRFEGRILKDDQKTPVPNALVKIKGLQTGKEYQARPSDAKGAFSFGAVKEGGYVLGIASAEGNFNFANEIVFKPGQTVSLVIALDRGSLKGFFTDAVGVARMVTSPGEEALEACRRAMLACEQSFSASKGETARLAYQRAMLACEQAYLDLFAASQPARVNEAAYREVLALTREARLALDGQAPSTAAASQDKSLGGDEEKQAKDETKTVKEKVAEKVEKVVEKVKEVIKEKLEPKPGPSTGPIRG